MEARVRVERPSGISWGGGDWKRSGKRSSGVTVSKL
jgi:hypothetical protein